MKLFVAVDADYALLPHFLRHYVTLGIDHFYIATTRSTVSALQERLISVHATIQGDLGPVDSIEGGFRAITQMRLKYSRPDEWVMIVDLDEFVLSDRSLTDIISRAESEGATVVRGRMIDRLAADGSLPAIRDDMDLWATFPLKCNLTSRLQGSVDHKGLLVKGHLEPTMAHHEFAGERVSTQQLQVDHFKWNSRAEGRVRAAMELARASGIGWWTEYERILHHLAQYGRIHWEEFVEPQ